jgi:hypothetical protein
MVVVSPLLLLEQSVRGASQWQPPLAFLLISCLACNDHENNLGVELQAYFLM